jgi:hypothetical protein
MTLSRKQIPSPNYSSRGGATVRLIVLHTAEGARTIEELGNFFANSSSQVSSHVGADDKTNIVGEYVKRNNKAWTAANANPYAVQIELCGLASWTKSQWKNEHQTMLENCAKWIAEEAAKFGIPITKLSPAQAQGSGRGVCQHKDLGSWGGGHHDCGSGFPMDDVLKMAQQYAGGGSGQGDDYMNPPAWLWDWLDWYETTDRDPAKKPKGAPDKIPDWAWDYQKEVHNIAKRKGMTQSERDWIDWRVAGSDPAKRPEGAPDTIPEFWWDDNSYVLAFDNPNIDTASRGGNDG